MADAAHQVAVGFRFLKPSLIGKLQGRHNVAEICERLFALDDPMLYAGAL